MSLSLYKKKRRFGETPEPAGKEKSSKKGLRFVIQKHDASHLHYDFRLEMEGVLKSWAIPKGPSLDPANKRLAMMVEDHPYDYRNFEGIIPAGNYGGGIVIVWDEGTYEPVDAKNMTHKEQEKQLLNQLHTGNLKIILHGKKIQGEFALFLMKGRGDRSWILMKKNDEFATTKDILANDESVLSGKTLIEIAKDNGTKLNHPEGAASKQIKAKPIQLLPEKVAKASTRKKTNKTSSGQKKSGTKATTKKNSSTAIPIPVKKGAVKKKSRP